MTGYSIVRAGNGYVVRFGNQGLLKIATRRKAEKLVLRATQLLAEAPASVIAQPTKVEPTDIELSTEVS